MWTYLTGALFTLWLPALCFGVLHEPGFTPSPRASGGPPTATKSEISNTKAHVEPEIYPDDTIPLKSGNMSIFETTFIKPTVAEVLSMSGITPEAITVPGSTARDTIVYGENVEESSILSALKTLSSKKYAINKCCQKGEYQSDMNSCLPLPGAGNISDPWWWIAPSQKQNLSLDTLTASQVSYQWKSCSKNMRVFRFFEKSNVTLHRRKDGIHLQTTVDFKDIESTYEFAPDSFCLDSDRSGIHFAILCPCTELVCLRKCCDLSYEFDPDSGKCTEASDDHYDWVPAFDNDWKIDQKHFTLHGVPKCGKQEQAFPVHDMRSTLDLVVMGNGSLKSNVTGALYPRDSFCADLTPSGNETVIVCGISATTEARAMSLAMGVLLAIGSLALLLTVCISCALPETRKRLHGRMALMHNSMLLVAYVTTGALHLITLWYRMSIAASKVISFVIQFSFLSAFFWLNVMCIDIALVFRGWRLVQGTAMQVEEKKFFYYSVYAWGSVFLISIATAIAEFVPGARPRPAFGEREYFFSNDGAKLLFFYGPMAVLLVANVILFIYTAIRIKMAAQESRSVLNCADSRTTKKNKFRLAVYAKLSTLMGVTWIFEVLSWAIGGDPRVWFLIDAANLLRAVFIFIIFCCNKQVYRQLLLHSPTFFSKRFSRPGTLTPTTGSSRLDKGSGKRPADQLNSAKELGGKFEESKKPSKCNLKEFVRPSSQTVIDSSQQQCIKDTQL